MYIFSVFLYFLNREPAGKRLVNHALKADHFGECYHPPDEIRQRIDLPATAYLAAGTK